MPEAGEYNGVIPSVLGELHDVARTPPADGDTLVWNATAGRWEPGAAQSGTSVPLTHVAFPFAFDTPGLITPGVTVYTPTIGEILFDAWFEVTTAWNGTTPQADLGPFIGPASGGYPHNRGLWNFNVSVGAVDLTQADDTQGACLRFNGDGSPSLVQSAAITPFGSTEVPAIDAVPVAAQRLVPVAAATAPNSPFSRSPRMGMATFVSTDPLRVVVSQDAGLGGDDPGATQGAAIVHLLILAAP